MIEQFEGVLICTDLDGTLLKNDKTISKKNKDAIEFFKENGGSFTFVTGRMPYTTDYYVNEVKPNVPIGCINGGGVYNIEKKCYEWVKCLPKEAAILLEYVEEMMPDIGYQANTEDGIYFCKDNEAMKWFRKLTATPENFCSYKDIEKDLLKVVYGDLDEVRLLRVAELLNNHPIAHKFDFVRSEARLYEILPKGITKASALCKLVEILGINKRRTVAIGDYYNDIEMVKEAGVGVAVANACEELKKVADYITVTNEEDAIAKVIEDIYSGKISF